MFCSRSADQSDLSRAWRIAEGGSQGHCSEAAEFRYERETQTPPNIYPWSAELDRLLTANESKAARERLTLIRLFEELRALIESESPTGAPVLSATCYLRASIFRPSFLAISRS